MKVVVFILCVLASYTLHIQQAHLGTSFPTGKMTLKSDVGTYLARCNNCGEAASPDSAAVHETDPASPWAIWTA